MGGRIDIGGSGGVAGGSQCGGRVCEAGLLCCNASCGACSSPKGGCPQSGECERVRCGRELCAAEQECCSETCSRCGDSCAGDVAACAPDCSPMDAHAVGDGEAFFGWAWNGTSCQGLYGTSCYGLNCEDTFSQGQDCTVAFAMCVSGI